MKAGNAIETLSKQPDWRKASGEKHGRARFEVDKEEMGRWVCSPACLSFSRREKKGEIATKSISPTYPREGDPGKESKADSTRPSFRKGGLARGSPQIPVSDPRGPELSRTPPASSHTVSPADLNPSPGRAPARRREGSPAPQDF